MEFILMAEFGAKCVSLFREKAQPGSSSLKSSVSRNWRGFTGFLIACYGRAAIRKPSGADNGEKMEFCAKNQPFDHVKSLINKTYIRLVGA